VAGIVYNDRGEVLLSSRPEGKAYAGYWEFAGGKVEAGESELTALRREFAEELGIQIHSAVPWLAKTRSYEHAHVRLRFFRVPADGWRGELQAREGQQWRWQQPGRYDVSPMLPANAALLAALKARQRELADVHGRHVPLFLKIAPDLDEAQVQSIAAALLEHGMDGGVAPHHLSLRSRVMTCLDSS